MKYQRYIKEKQNLLDIIHQFIEDDNNSEEVFQTLVSFIQTEKYEENRDEFKLILHFINNISNNHYRSATFNAKIERILLFYSEFIKQQFNQKELFNIFQNNKRLLHFLITNGILKVDERISYLITKKVYKDRKAYVSYFKENQEFATKYFEKKKKTIKNYDFYFYPEIKPFLNEESRTNIEKVLMKDDNFDLDEFNRNRRIGENESKICELIRNDSIKEFVIYVTKNNIKLTSEVNESIFETNPLLLHSGVSLIEYAAFFGSFEIFQYLRLNNIELTSSLWKYSIHGKNAEIIHLLEENQIKPEDDNYTEILKQSIKCHHNDIANYIIDNLICKIDEVNASNFKENKIAFGFHFHNYEFIQNYDNGLIILFYACLYDYMTIVKGLLSKNKINLYLPIILSHLFFNRIFIYI